MASGSNSMIQPSASMLGGNLSLSYSIGSWLIQAKTVMKAKIAGVISFHRIVQNHLFHETVSYK